MNLKNTYYLSRHGETRYQAENISIIYPYPEPEPIALTQRGREQIQKRASELKRENMDLLFSSDLFRTQQTSQIYSEVLGLGIMYDERLREINMGDLRGQPIQKLFEMFPNPQDRFEKASPNGESWRHVKKRLTSFVEEKEREHTNKHILIVSHGDPLWLLVGVLHDWDEATLLAKHDEVAFAVGQWRKVAAN